MSQSKYNTDDADKGYEQSYLNDLKDNIVWDEVSTSMVGNNLFEVQGRIDYNFADLTVDYNTNARYNNEFVGNVKQMPHKRKDMSEIRPHIHWVQNSDNTPNILIEYRAYNNGEQIPNVWQLKALTSADNKLAFAGVGTCQITEFNLPTTVGEALNISGTFECKIYRDSANASGLFAGADSYSGVFSIKYYDIHFQIDQMGSRDEFVK